MNVSFAYFIFVFTRSLNEIDTEELNKKEGGDRYSFKQIRTLLFINFLSPLFLALIFIDDLLGTSLVNYM